MEAILLLVLAAACDGSPTTGPMTDDAGMTPPPPATDGSFPPGDDGGGTPPGTDGGGGRVEPPPPVFVPSGTSLDELASRLVPGEWAELETVGFGNALLESCDGGHNIFEYSNDAAWDPVHGELHFVGQGHYAPCRKHIVYRASTNEWAELTRWSTDESDIGHAYEHNTGDPATGDHYYRHYSSKRVMRFDGATRAWSDLPLVATEDPVQVAGALEWFPELGGPVLVDSYIGAWVYETSAGRWRQLAGGALVSGGLAMGPYDNFAAYVPAEHALYLGGGNDSRDLHRIDATGTVTTLGSLPTGLGPSMGMVMADPVSGTLLAFADDGTIWAHDAATDDWTVAGSHPVMDRARDWRVGAPVSTYGVMMFATFNFDDSVVLVYRHAS